MGTLRDAVKRGLFHVRIAPNVIAVDLLKVVKVRAYVMALWIVYVCLFLRIAPHVIAVDLLKVVKVIGIHVG